MRIGFFIFGKMSEVREKKSTSEYDNKVNSNISTTIWSSVLVRSTPSIGQFSLYFLNYQTFFFLLDNTASCPPRTFSSTDYQTWRRRCLHATAGRIKGSTEPIWSVITILLLFTNHDSWDDVLIDRTHWCDSINNYVIYFPEIIITKWYREKIVMQTLTVVMSIHRTVKIFLLFSDVNSMKATQNQYLPNNSS